MAPVSETQTSSEVDTQIGQRVKDTENGVFKTKRRKGNGTDSRGGRKRHAGSLPTCQVCFNPGSGFHYGADTCEPCKTFFRRNVSLKGKLECRRGNACKPIPSKKFKCTACRLKRCLEVGMSLEGIKLGRYTDSKRAENRAFEAGLKFLHSETSTEEKNVPHALPFLMTPPNTPPEGEEAQNSLSPDGDRSPLRQQCGKKFTSEINNAVNSLLANAKRTEQLSNEEVIDAPRYSPPLANIQLNQNESLVMKQMAAPPSRDGQPEIYYQNISFEPPASDGLDISQKETSKDVNSIGGSFNSPDLIKLTFSNPEVTQPDSTSSALLDSILFDSGNQSAPQEASVCLSEMNSQSPLAFAVLGEQQQEIINVPSFGDANICTNTFSDISFNATTNTFDVPNDKEERHENLGSIPQIFPLSPSGTGPSIVTSASPHSHPVHSQPPDSQDILNTMPAGPAVPRLITGSTSIVLDTFIDYITNTYNHYDAHGSDFFQKIHRHFFEYLETRSMKKRMFGSLRPLPLPEYRQILLETGLDVDGRLQQLTHRQLPNYEKGYFLYLNFVRDVPGFRDLPMEDQDILIKGARVDYWMLSEFDCFNVEMGLHVLPDGFVMGVEDKALVFGRPFIKRMFVAAGQFQKLGLTERERNILKCIYIFSRGNNCSTPEGIATTERHHAFFKQVLQYCREREGRLSISNELDSRLEPLMKEMGELEEKDWEEFFALWKDFPMIKFPPVTKSFYFGSPTSDHSPVFSK